MAIHWSKKRRIALRVALFFMGISAVSLALNFVFPLPDQIPFSQVITDRNGKLLHAFMAADGQWRMKTELREISPVLKTTVLFKEDRFFYYHPGVNPLAIGRALIRNIVFRRRTSGASTITMQVARMLEPKRRTYGNKLIEIFRALQLEWKYSKDEILQLYLSLVPYGGNIQGVKSAAVLLFQKSPDQLSLAEVTALSIIPNRPSSLRLGRNNAYLFQERNRWLKRFLKSGLFDERTIALASDEPITAVRHNAPQLAPHLSRRLSKSAQGNIATTLDLNTQQQVEKLVADYMPPLRFHDIYNAAVVVINNHTHEVVAYVGSADFNDQTNSGQVDGVQAIRQPGSTLKPLLYGLCMDAGLLTPKTMLHDVPINIKGYIPENFDETFHGYVSMEYALCNSLNIPAVKALNDLGKEHLIEPLVHCGFQQVRKDAHKLGLSMILGGCGVTLEELTGLFSAFANEGQYQPPRVIREERADSASYRLISPSANFMITEILSRLARPDLPVNWEASAHTPRIAWKTGTSYGRKDAWSIGFNRDFTVGVWLGNFNGHGAADLSGATSATPLLFKIFNAIDYNAENEWFHMPKACNMRLVCSETGLLPNSFCKNTVMDYFIPMISSNKVCDNNQEVAVSADESISYCNECRPQSGYKKKWYEIVAPEMQTYFASRRIPYATLPPHNPNCERVFVKGAPAITFPVSGLEYYVDVNDPQPLSLRCETTGEVQWVYWYINDQFYRKAHPSDKVFFQPQEGKVKLSCTDDKGRNTNGWILVKYVKI
ncbi:MAG: penicillin-binding protein 1C [Chitinophagales bacterium]